MRTIIKLIFFIAVACVHIFSLHAQTITGTASALLITPIALVKNVDMNFGNLAVSSTTAGTVVLTPASTRTTGGSGGVTLPATRGTVSAADFTVSGQGGYTYAITLPTSATLSDGAGHSMTINTFTSTPSATGTLSGGGSQDLTVGATLIVTAAQVSAAYTNATAVPVTVNYN
jgi:hypothetical protein